jgi:hypothetical protein
VTASPHCTQPPAPHHAAAAASSASRRCGGQPLPPCKAELPQGCPKRPASAPARRAVRTRVAPADEGSPGSCTVPHRGNAAAASGRRALRSSPSCGHTPSWAQHSATCNPVATLCLRTTSRGLMQTQGCCRRLAGSASCVHAACGPCGHVLLQADQLRSGLHAVRPCGYEPRALPLRSESCRVSRDCAIAGRARAL